MEYIFEVIDCDLEFLDHRLDHGSFVCNRWSVKETDICSRLLELQVIEEVYYNGIEGCYNPRYKLTGLGNKVLTQFQERIENASQTNAR